MYLAFLPLLLLLFPEILSPFLSDHNIIALLCLMLQFLKEQQLSASEAIALDIQQQLLLAPKKQRTKYGKRTHLSEEQRLALSRQRNREHARATRLRKKIFKQVPTGLHYHLAIHSPPQR